MTRTARASGLFVLSILVAAILLLVWNGSSRYRHYLDTQQQLAARSAGAAASEIQLQVEQLRRRVLLFADEERDLIGELARNPNDSRRYDELSERLDRHFSDRFAFAVAASDGTTLVDDIDNLVGDLCRLDILEFASGDHPNRVYMHPQPGAYHFDIMARLDEAGGGAVFFVSFHPTLIARVLRNSELQGHCLLLVLAEQDGLIELASDGARDHIGREPRLSPKERARVSVEVPVAGTAWTLVDLPDPGLHRKMQQAIWRETGLFALALVLIAAAMLRFLQQSEAQRFAAEGRLRKAQHELELRVKDRTQRLSHANTELQRQIVERREAERQLREREAVLRAILESAVDAVVVIDDAGTVHMFNTAAERMFGYRADEVVGRNVNVLMPSPHQEDHDGYLRRYLETGERRIIGIGRDVPGKHRDGSTFPVHLAVSEVDLGKRKLFAGILRDLRGRT
jgi:PAS domain S-box-containing protein